MNFKKYKVVYLLGLIMVLAFGVRIYNLNDWLYFQADQVRNTNHAHEILDLGVAGLPLLGPKAGGTDFHLGPASYYLEYLPVMLFGLNHPAIIVYSNLFFIILSIPLVYYFLRQSFSKNTSLQTTTLYAFSYVVIQYSRFSWNPNSMLLWGLLFVLATYKIFTVENKKTASKWFLILAVSYGIVSQLHTTALLGYPGIFVLFWLYKRLDITRGSVSGILLSVFKKGNDRLFKINWKYWLGATIILMGLYIPVIVFDIQNNGHNLKEFSRAFTGKTASDKTVGQKLSREFNLMGKYYTLNVFSLNYKETSFMNHKGFRGVNFIGIALLISAIGIIIYRSKYRNRDGDKKSGLEMIIRKRDFLMLNFIWWMVFSVLFFPLAYKLDQMRFWFIAFLIPYIALAVLFEWIKESKYGKGIVSVIVVFILILNLTAVAHWYGGLYYQDGQSRFGRQATDSTLQQVNWVTYEKMLETVEYMSVDSRECQRICFKAPVKSKSAYRYIFKNNFSKKDIKMLRGNVIPSDLSECSIIYIIKHSNKTTEDMIADYKKDGKKIELSSPEKFGVITIWKVESIKVLE